LLPLLVDVAIAAAAAPSRPVASVYLSAGVVVVVLW
jgi:hypothetical protein